MNRVSIGMGSCGLAAGGKHVQQAIEASLRDLRIETQVRTTGCAGMCYREVLVELASDELGVCLYGDVTPELAPALVVAHFLERVTVPGRVVSRDGVLPPGSGDARFLGGQTRIVLRNCGKIDPESIDDYLAVGGYAALRLALSARTPAQVIDEIEASGLRGRGGAGFSTARKWRLAREIDARERYLICNADEGDPGAFMDRNLIEGDPFGVLEGMTIAAYAIGASRAIVYVRDEYPLAVERMTRAVELAQENGLLGEGVLGTGFALDVVIKRGAGAFVCGEETALIASLEGRRGTPHIRPPYPVQRGLHGLPTMTNNVETFANVPWIIRYGPERLRVYGVGASRGTKVFSLAGDVRRTGLVEVPMGTSLHTIIHDIGGGSASGRPIKAVQIGGPAGGCLPASIFTETLVDYESLVDTGVVMGSGGMVVMDQSTCMVDVARYFLAFCADESCGKCTFCRIGTRRMLEIMDRLCAGKGRASDLAALETLCDQVSANSLCGLGKAAPNPVLTTLRYFRHEYEAHLAGKCEAGRCRALITFVMDLAACEGCTLCLKQCAMVAISQRPRQIPLAIDVAACVRCGGCFHTCPYRPGAALRRS